MSPSWIFSSTVLIAAAVAQAPCSTLHVQAPSDSTLGPVNVQLTRDGTPSVIIQANYVASARGVHLSGASVGDVSGTLPAKPGEINELFATGLGSSPGGIVPPLTVLPTMPSITMRGATQAITAYLAIAPR